MSQVSNNSEKLNKIINTLSRERKELVGFFEQLRNNPSVDKLFALGTLFEKHIRNEERMLFQQIQLDLGENEMA